MSSAEDMEEENKERRDLVILNTETTNQRGEDFEAENADVVLPVNRDRYVSAMDVTVEPPLPII